ncbi:MAG: ABC transporter ATP-binding protein [Gemmatimonadetes bacterium]|nr:ABC transporter ATP-binding protein [Gemmatimonadota bacterium]
MKLNPFGPFSTFLYPYRWWIARGLILLLVVQAISLSIPLILKEAIDTVKAEVDLKEATDTVGTEVDGLPIPLYTDSTEGDLLLYAGLLAGLALLSWVMSIGMRWYLTGSSRLVERNIRRAYVRHLMTLPLSFFQERQVGDLMARATNDVEAIQRFLHHAFRMSLTGVLTFVISLGLMCTIDWELALLSLAPMPAMVLITRSVGRRVRNGYRQVQEQFAAMSARIQESLSGVRVIKAFALGADEVERFGHLNQEYVDKNHRLVNIRSLFFPFTFLLNGVSMIVILWLGGLRVIDESLTLGSFVAFNAYLIRMGRPMMMLGRIVDEYQRAVASMGRIMAVIREVPQIADGADLADLTIRGEIEFRHLCFAYNGQTVLSDVDIRVPAGGSLAVVGRVGSGKTTLARLIPRLIEAGSGQLLIDGTPVEEIPLQRLRAAIGYVPQDTFLFSDTIGENIGLGIEDGNVEQVEDAVEVAQLKTDLQTFPQQLETIVGERGVTLSGGQKQRTALARAVIRQPRILILDDALASVDTRTEEEILGRLRRIMAERTTILIAHRISTVKDADQIVVLDEGRIAERGTHDELVAHNGIYADLFRRQHLTRELDEL